MSEKRCERCDEPFWPREAKQRFCTRACSDASYAEERREAVKQFRQQKEQHA